MCNNCYSFTSLSEVLAQKSNFRDWRLIALLLLLQLLFTVVDFIEIVGSASVSLIRVMDKDGTASLHQMEPIQLID